MLCQYCGNPLPPGTHGKRASCNDAHKQAQYRASQQLRQHKKVQAQLLALQAQVQAKDREIAQMHEIITLLKQQLNLEHRYLTDTHARNFPSFLRTQPPSPLSQKILAHPDFPARASHWTYEHLLTSLGSSKEELLPFKDLWKALLLYAARVPDE